MKDILPKLIPVLIIAILLTNCGNDEEIIEEEKAKVVETISAVAGLPEGLVAYKTGTLQPKSEVNVVSEGAGKVVEVYFQEGDEVVKGQTLARLGEALSNTQDQINQAQASVALSNATQALNSVQSQAGEAVTQSKIALENAVLAYQNAIKSKDITEVSLTESEKSAQVAVETAELVLKNTQSSSSQSISSIYENAVTTARSAITNADNALTGTDKILGTGIDPNINKSYRDFLGAAMPASFQAAKDKYVLANEKRTQINEIMTKDNIRSVLPQVEDYLRTVISVLKEIDIVLKNTPPSPSLTQSQIDGWTTNNNAQVSALNGSLAGTEQAKQGIDSTVIGSTTSLDSAEKGLESANQQLKTTAAVNKVQKENLQYAIDIAERNMRNAEASLRSAADGAKGNIIGAENALNSARQQYNLTTLARNNVTVTAPISGKITSKKVDPGTSVSPGSLIATISVLGKLKMDIDYNYTESQYLADSGEVEILIDGNEQNIVKGEIVRVSPTADPVTRQIAVEVEVNNPDEVLKSNLIAEVQIPFRKEYFQDKILLPLKAVRIGQDQKSVMIINGGGKIAELPIAIGAVYGGYIEVLGLEEGQEVIAEIGNLQIGEKVKNYEVKYTKPANLGIETAA